MLGRPSHFIGRLLWAAALAAAWLGTTCSFPTDKSDQVVVLITAPAGVVVIRGEKIPVSAKAIRVVGTDTVEVKNIEFSWSSGNRNVATVEDQGFGSAEVTGVNPGTAEIVARAVAFERASVGDLPVRVANPVEVDSVRPALARYGNTITVYGVGVDSIVVASLGEAELIEYPFSRTRDSTGLARISYWVPPPAHTDSLFFLGNGVFGWARDTTRVTRVDLYEPNDVSPRLLALDGPRPFAGTTLSFLLFHNPALAFEALPRDVPAGADWYRLQQTTPRALTIRLNSASVGGTFLTFLTDSLGFNPATQNFFTGSQAWTFGPSSHNCKGFGFSPTEAPAESTVVALAAMPAGNLDAVAVYTQQGPYGLTVIEGYVTSKGVTRDALEENDFCNAADGTTFAISPPFRRDSLTIDNPHDVDWIRFSVGGVGPQAVRFQTASRPQIAAVTDTSDIDLYVLTVPGGGVSPNLVLVAADTAAGSAVDRVLLLDPGQYYAVVVDFAGVPTRYAICIGGCVLPFPLTQLPVAPRPVRRQSARDPAAALRGRWP